MPARVLLVDDEPVDVLAQALHQRGLEVEVRRTAAEGIAVVCAQGCDVLAIDGVLGDELGIDVIRTLRAEGYTLPIVFYTRRLPREDCVFVLRMGADDFVLGRFHGSDTSDASVAELVARVELWAERAKAGVRHTMEPVVAGPLRVQRPKLSVQARRVEDGAWIELDLTRTEREILFVLSARVGEAVSKDYLLDSAWGAELERSQRTVETAVSRIREKLTEVTGTPGDQIIVTLRGRGCYVLVGDAKSGTVDPSPRGRANRK